MFPILNFCFWLLDVLFYGFLIVGFGFWILRFGFCIICIEFQNVSVGFLDLGFDVLVLCFGFNVSGCWCLRLVFWVVCSWVLAFRSLDQRLYLPNMFKVYVLGCNVYGVYCLGLLVLRFWVLGFRLLGLEFFVSCVGFLVLGYVFRVLMPVFLHIFVFKFLGFKILGLDHYIWVLGFCVLGFRLWNCSSGFGFRILCFVFCVFPTQPHTTATRSSPHQKEQTRPAKRTRRRRLEVRI